MIFAFDQKGNNVMNFPSGSLHQGSNFADEIIVLAPISPSSVVTMSARLPNGLYVYPALGEDGKNPFTLANMDTRESICDPAGAVYSAFRILVPATMTQYAGTLTVQFTFTMGHNAVKDAAGAAVPSEGQTVTTQAIELIVTPGTASLAPSFGKEDFSGIQKYLNAAKTAQDSAKESADSAEESQGIAKKSAEEAKEWAIAAENRNLNFRNGVMRGSLVQVPANEEKAGREPTREYQVLLGENPPAEKNDLFEVDDKFAVRADGSIYAPGEPQTEDDLIRRRDAPPLISPPEKDELTLLYGVFPKSDVRPDGEQAGVKMSPRNLSEGVIPCRMENGDIRVPMNPTAEDAAASKNFVNSSIATNTATFRGTFGMTEREFQKLGWQDDDPNKPYYAKHNDYAFLYEGEPPEQVYTRYKRVSSTWEKEYKLNNSGFTSAQWNAINSGVDVDWKENVDSDIEWFHKYAATRSEVNRKRNLVTPDVYGGKVRLYAAVPPGKAGDAGTQNYVPAGTSNLSKYSVPQRTDGGNILVPLEPAEDGHAVSKYYVDRKMGSGTYATRSGEANYPTGFTGNSSSTWWANGELSDLGAENLITDWQKNAGGELCDIAFVRRGNTANIVVDGNVYVASGDANNQIKRTATTVKYGYVSKDNIDSIIAAVEHGNNVFLGGGASGTSDMTGGNFVLSAFNRYGDKQIVYIASVYSDEDAKYHTYLVKKNQLGGSNITTSEYLLDSFFS